VHGFESHKTAPAAVLVIKKCIVQIEKDGSYHGIFGLTHRSCDVQVKKTRRS
jgi:hypothetical protein